MDYEGPDPYDEYDSEEERERMLELEAELYSKLHYAMETPELEEQPEEVSDEVLDVQPVIYNEILEAKMLSVEKPADDSGHCSTKSDEASETSSALKESKYEEESVKVVGSEDSSSDDEGIQLIGAMKTQPKKPLAVLTVNSSDSDSEVELVGSKFKKSVTKPKVSVIEERTPKAVAPPALSSDSDSSVSDSEVELGSSIRLNVVGAKTVEKRFISFAEITRKDVPMTPNHPTRYEKWTEDMKLFYNTFDPKKADLTLEEYCKDMRDDPELWKVDPSDLYRETSSPGRSRYFNRRTGGPRCNNCYRFGHHAKECPEPERPVVCYMCGVRGHEKNNCPRARCLRCGMPDTHYSNNGCVHCRKLRNTICLTCGVRGHLKQDCPNNWRRFHATTSGTVPVIPEGGQRPAKDTWCPNCAKKGHYLHQCRAYNPSPYPPEVLYVVDYGVPSPDRETPPESEKKCKKSRIREIKAKRREFLSLNSTPKSENPAKRLKMSGVHSTPTTRDVCAVDHRLKKASKALRELLDEQERSELQSSSKRWRKRKRISEKLKREEDLPRKRKNNKKKEMKFKMELAKSKRKGDEEVSFPRGNFIPLKAKKGASFKNVVKAEKLCKFRGQKGSKRKRKTS